ncbi:MAG TPA: hypothetical protein VFE47_04535 [Tepidisphaeraceae bacterium]|jgi:hypothetical protein|nr:hypothetical protein [Tepidisphaeraceae bacterium]
MDEQDGQDESKSLLLFFILSILCIHVKFIFTPTLRRWKSCSKSKKPGDIFEGSGSFSRTG